MEEQTKTRKSFKSPRLTEVQKQQIIDLHKAGVCPFQISKLMKITSKTVYVYLDKFGLRNFNRKNSARRKYIINEDFFETIDSAEKVYWLGYLAAHSNIDIHSKFIIIEVSAKDLSHLQNLLYAISSTYPVHNKIVNGYTVYCVKIYSSKLIKDINKHNIRNKKSGHLMWPDLEESNIKHYMRGYFDGKGFWGIYPEKNVFVFSVRGQSQTYMNKFREIIRTKCNLKQTKPIAKKSCFVIQFCGRLQCTRIFDYLYSGTDIYLERKYVAAKLLTGIVIPVGMD